MWRFPSQDKVGRAASRRCERRREVLLCPRSTFLKLLAAPKAHRRLVAFGGVAAILLLQKLGVRAPLAYAVPAIVVWAGAYAAGVHPTLAGVIVGLMTPVRAWFGTERFLEVTEKSVSAMRGDDRLDGRTALPHLHALDVARREAVAPVERLQHALHGWVAFGVMPLFALANAGVPLGDASFDGDGLRVFLGIALGLLLGKLLGVVAFSWVAHRLGLTTLPKGVGWREIVVVASCAGVGLTMALFIAQLAFQPGPVLETAKLAVLSASAVAGVLAYMLGVRTLKPRLEPGARP